MHDVTMTAMTRIQNSWRATPLMAPTVTICGRRTMTSIDLSARNLYVSTEYQSMLTASMASITATQITVMKTVFSTM